MTISLTQLGLLIFGYLLFLFATAYMVERKWVPEKWVKHPAIYVLSLGVYASAWAFYGSVGMANEYGYGFLTYYLGISAAFALSPLWLRPILYITTTYQLSSLADLFAFRYRSRLAGAVVTLFTLVFALPLLALQISAVASSMHILNSELPTQTLALGFCATMIVFAVLFGARHVSPRTKHSGLVFALAFESILKLVALVTLSAVALYTVFDGSVDLDNWLSTHKQQLMQGKSSIHEGPWRTLLLVFFASAVVMPHMFHVAFTENLNKKALRPASWGLPLFLLIMSLAVPPILWAGVKLNLTVPVEYYALGIGMALNSPFLVMLTFVGGLAAAAGVIIVITLATAAMVLNHIVLPSYKPSPKQDFYQWLLWMRRTLIAAIIMAAYGFYLLVGSKLNLSQLGIIAFVAALQFFPGIFGVLYWPKANRQGFIAGLAVGILVWLYAMLLPLMELKLGVDLLIPLPNTTEDNWYIPAIASFIANGLTFGILSLTTKSKASEAVAAEACSVDTITRPNRQPLLAGSSNDIIVALSKPLGRYVAEREVHQALNDIGSPSFEDRPYALRRLRAKLEANLSGLMGPTVAHDIIGRSLPLQNDSVLSGDIYHIEQRLEGFHDRFSGLAGELDSLRRYHRQTLEKLPMGVCTLANDLEILMWNSSMQELTSISTGDVVGSRLTNIAQPWADLLHEFAEDDGLHLHKKRIEIEGKPHWFNLHKSIMQGTDEHSGIVILLEDQTETQLLEEELIHSERLASIGRLAAGVAHEVGNPITGIDCLAQSMRYETDNPELLEMADQIQEQTRRVTRIVQSLMNFSHAGHHSTEHEPVTLSICVDEAMQLLKLSNQGRDINYLNQCMPEHIVEGDSQRLVQVFINLLSNARDASEDDSQIVVSSEVCEHKVIIRVIDQGTGIEADKLEHIFEPFFTTKEVGKGTGLGMALVYSIIEEHYGRIAVESPPQGRSAGTQVTIDLPCYSNTENKE